MLVEPLPDGLENMFVLPAGDPALPARGAAMLDGACLAGVIGRRRLPVQARRDFGPMRSQVFTALTNGISTTRAAKSPTGVTTVMVAPGRACSMATMA